MKNQDDPSARAASRARHARSSAAKMAEALNLSRSMIERTRRLAKLASPELLERMRDGELTVRQIELMVGINPKLSRWDRLVKAWNQASDDDRARFISILLEEEPE